MSSAPHHPQESCSNAARDQVARYEPRSLRTYTPTQAVLAKSAGIFHWTPEGRRLYDFSSGVLVANLGHNSDAWLNRYSGYMGWTRTGAEPADHDANGRGEPPGFTPALPMTAYNAVTE